MANPYYGVTGNPVTLSRGTSGLMRAEFGLIEVGFDAANAQILLRGLIAGQTWTGTHIFPTTTSIGVVTSDEIARLSGVTSGIQSQIDGKGAITGQSWSGAHNFTGGSISVPTAVVGDASSAAASTSFVTATSFSTSLPGQVGNAGKFVTTDGTNASWASVSTTPFSDSAALAQLQASILSF